MPNSVIPARISEARQIRGLNISQLASELGLTRQAVSRYELGSGSPSAKTLDKICEVLNLPAAFFYKPIDSGNVHGTVFYRSFKSSDAKQRTAIDWKCKWSMEVFEYLSNYVNMPDVNIDMLLKDDCYSIEDLAVTLRKYWGIGLGPIANLMPLFEKNGILVSGGKIEHEKTDGCSTWINGRPVIFMGSEDNSSSRQNFTLAHELGHIIMHSHITKDEIQNKSILETTEREANMFAGAFLMPMQSFPNDIYSTSIDAFVNLKRKWNVSIAAMIYRCGEIKIISDIEKLNLNKYMSKNHWRKVEPLDRETARQKPKLYEKALDLLKKNALITLNEILDVLRWSEKDLLEICALHDNFFSDASQIPPLQLI